ncbi:MAP kinase phosphatase [Coprinopsis sp. MPI-PUGE-AT-0042]|nr:MAP kinase phosphatase [Coprinopsis sp. MPI-PUGE-AT-0042]
MLAPPHDLSPKPPRTPNSGKRFRPPVLDITQALERKPAVQLEIGPTPVKLRPGDTEDNNDDDKRPGDEEDDDEEGEILQLSSPETPNFPLGKNGAAADEIEKELQSLEQLRRSVKKNLKLRPIRSRTNLKIDPGTPGRPLTSSSTLPLPPNTASSWADSNPPESALESYFTPMTDTPHHPVFTPGPSSHINAPPLPATTTTAIITDEPLPLSRTAPPIANTNTNNTTTSPPARPIPPKELHDRLRSPKRPLLIDARSLAAHEAFHIRTSINIAIPSLILKRCKKPGGGFQTLNALRQYITTEHGKVMWDELVGEAGSTTTSNGSMSSHNGSSSGNDQWDGDVVIYDDDMNLNDKNNVGSTAWAVLPVLAPLLSFGSVGYLEGGISSAGHDLELQTLILSGEEAAAAVAGTMNDTTSTTVQAVPQQKQQGGQQQQQKNGLMLKKKASAGLFQLDTQTTYRQRQLPELEPPSTVDEAPSTGFPPMPRSPLPLMPTASSSSSSSSLDSSSAKSSSSPNTSIMDSSPSPPPSSLAGFRRPPPPRRPSAPNLRRSMERINTDLPKLSLRTKPMRSATLAAPPSLTLQVPSGSPSHLKLTHSSHSPVSQTFGRSNGPASAYPSESFRTPFYTPPHSPGTPKANFNFSVDVSTPPLPGSQQTLPRSNFGHIPDPPPTARPDAAGFDFDRPLSTGEEEDAAFAQFVVSTILPGFLFLGPEVTTKEHVDELKELGVKRILNIAAECDDDQGLGLRDNFRYLRIPMRDTVEEDNITNGVKEACAYLDDARLHSAPTYVHCKAGKSRSVTAVMAYLIHANRWTLSRAYSFVMERRKGISPNIGFVSELMNFEEHELGNKSTGVQPSAPVGAGGTTIDMRDGFAAAIASGDRGGHGPGHGHSQSVSGVMMGSMGSGTSSMTSGSSYASARSGPHHHPATAHMVRSRTYVRDSLPGHMGMGDEEGSAPGPPIDLVDRVMGDPGGEVEIKDASGRYRHVRRPPVNENTLQPMRRASKAGLESSSLKLNP